MLLIVFFQNNQTFIFLKFVTRWWSQHEALNLFMSILFFSPLFPSWLHIAIECILFLLTMIKLFSLLNCQVFFPSSLLIITKLFFDLFNLLMLIDYISRGPKKQTLLSLNALFLFILSLFLQSFKLLVWRFLML